MFWIGVVILFSALFRMFGLITEPNSDDPKFLSDPRAWYVAMKRRRQPIYAIVANDISVLFAYCAAVAVVMFKIWP